MTTAPPSGNDVPELAPTGVERPSGPVLRARRVSARLVLDVRSTCDLSLLVAAARTPGWQVDDELVVHLDGSELPEGARPVEVPVGPAGRGERMHVLTGVPQGELVVEYSGTVAPGDGADPAPAADPEQAARDRFELNRPSRYCPSDELAAFAAAEFGSRRERSDADLAAAVERWVADRLVYTSGSSTSFDGAVQTMLRGQGVCRDYAHLVVALCRALELPARLTAVYAPGLSPMDFHAVAEVRVVRDDGAADWEVLDATRLAPRRALSRISTGRDAADTAFLTSLRGGLVLQQMTVTAVLDGDLPAEDGGRTVLA
nr:transglutaminase family protein [Quadrisphaera sp. INWT6]